MDEAKACKRSWKSAKSRPATPRCCCRGKPDRQRTSARAIHRMSKRKDNSFVKLNCAAIPSGLLRASVCHERGAFTGAVARKVGRLELATAGLLFLDEIGEIPLELQPKLCGCCRTRSSSGWAGIRPLEGRLPSGGRHQPDLLKSVNLREFASGLVLPAECFPLRTPPLRERRRTCPLLIEHFARSTRAG